MGRFHRDVNRLVFCGFVFHFINATSRNLMRKSEENKDHVVFSMETNVEDA